MKHQEKHRTRLTKIERKCDKILAELIILRHQLTHNDIDATIDKLHRQAKKLRQQCEKERIALRKVLLSENKLL